MIGLKSWTQEDRLTHSYWILKRHLIHPLMSSLKAKCLATESVARHWKGEILFLLQTTTSCCKWSKIWLGSGFVGCPPGHRSWSLLFSLYINDISSDIESEIRLFADDCVCYREIKDEKDTMKLQRDIDRLGSWARKWGMRFQPVKCNMMQLTRKRIKKIHASYTLEGTNLENVESIKYLGVTITSDLRWNTHVSNVCTKANRTLGFLRRNLYSCPQEVKEAAYKGLVRPVLD